MIMDIKFVLGVSLLVPPFVVIITWLMVKGGLVDALKAGGCWSSLWYG